MSPWVWILLVVLVLAGVVIGLTVSRHRTQQSLESRREEAAALRDEAAEHRVTMRENETAAAASGAQAQRARAEAEQRAEEARELEAMAQQDREALEAARGQHDEQMRRADALDPDVRTDDEGYRLDDDGNRADWRSGPGVADQTDETDETDKAHERDGEASASMPGSGEEPVREVRPGEEVDADGADDADRGYTTQRTPEGGYGSAERTVSGDDESGGRVDETVSDATTGDAAEEGGNRAGNWAGWESTDTGRRG